jgi:hypothetical protein
MLADATTRSGDLTKGESRGEDDAGDDEGDSWVKVQSPSTLAADYQRTPWLGWQTYNQMTRPAAMTPTFPRLTD